mmetsp:Transcript_26046/g.62968  ORF Transcript_26046/g.62968 Transcript_26046/m.62968 type:complete len:529 (-) Transcript_26046:33-1619(-)
MKELEDRETKLAQEQEELEAQMEKEREAFRRQIAELKAKNDEAAVREKTHQVDSAAQLIEGLISKVKAQRVKAQVLTASLAQNMSQQFELDSRQLRAQYKTMQPCVVEVNRICNKLALGISFSFFTAAMENPHAKDNTAAVARVLKLAGVSTGTGTGAVGTGSAAGLAALAQEVAGEFEHDALLRPRKTVLKIKVTNNRKNGATQIWTTSKFMSRLQKMWQARDATGPSVEDIFWDDTDHFLVGSAALVIEPVIWGRAIQDALILQDIAGQCVGVLDVEVKAQLVPSKSEISKGDPISITVHFGRATLNGAAHWSRIFVRFSFFGTKGAMTLESPTVPPAPRGDLNHTYTFSTQAAPDDLLTWLRDEQVAIQVRGFDAGSGNVTELKERLVTAETKVKSLEAALAKHGKGKGKQSAPKPEGEIVELRKKMQLAEAKARELEEALDRAEGRNPDQTGTKSSAELQKLRQQLQEEKAKVAKLQSKVDGDSSSSSSDGPKSGLEQENKALKERILQLETVQLQRSAACNIL